MNTARTSRGNLIVVYGIFPEDFKMVAPEPPGQLYDILPSKFTSIAEWPQSTNLKCWHCDLIPESFPKFVPENPRRIGGVLVCDTVGNFCEWNCVVAFVLLTYPKMAVSEIIASVCWFAKLFNENSPSIIIASPRKTIMRQYCGGSGITQEEYREQIANLNKNYKIQKGRGE